MGSNKSRKKESVCDMYKFNAINQVIWHNVVVSSKLQSTHIQKNHDDLYMSMP